MVAICKDHPARDEDGAKIWAGISAAAWRVSATLAAIVLPQSQRDCVLQPKVARIELPWVMIRE